MKIKCALGSTLSEAKIITIPPGSITVYIPIEIKSRELHSKLALSVLLVQEGMNVVIGQKGQVIKFAEKQLLPGVYFNKSVGYPKYAETYAKFKLNNILILAQDEEHGATLKLFENFFRNRESLKYIDYIDGYLCWGSNDFTYLSKSFANKVYLTGSPRTSFWGKSGISLLRDEIIFLQAKYGDFILIATNFPIANSAINFMDLVNFRKSNHLSKGININTLNTRRNIEYNLMTLYTEFIQNLIDNCQKNVVIRPHPTENSHFWKKFADHNKKVFIDSKSNISSLIHASASVVHSNSTVGLEALASQKRVVSLTSEDFEIFFSQYLPNSISKSFYNSKDATKYISDESLQEFVDLSEILEDRFYGLGTLAPMHNIVNIIKRLTLSISWNKLDKNIKVNRFQFRVKMMFIYNYFALPDLTRRKLGSFKKKQIIHELKSYASALGLNSDIKVNTVGPNAFLIQKDNI